MGHKRNRTLGVVIALISVGLVGCASSTGSTTVRLAPTARPTVAVLNTPLPGQAWVTAPELALMRNLAFAKSDPLTGYACGASVTVVQSPADVLLLSVTHDGGRTWSAAAPSTAPGATCWFSINPARADDVVMTAGRCYSGCGDGPITSYRSHDGGKTWVALQFDASQWHSSAQADWQLYRPAWIGDTVYFAVVPPSNNASPTRPEHVLVSNTTGNLLSAASGSVDSLISDPQAAPQGIWAHGSTLVMTFSTIPVQSVESTDGGATWQRFTLTVSGLSGPLNFIYFSDGAVALINYYPASSADGGATWRILPMPSGEGVSNSTAGPLYQAPDGTIMFVVGKTIWRLAPGAASWVSAAPTITSSNIPTQVLAYSTDQTGHVVLAWAEASRNIVNGVLQPGIAYHGLG